MHDLHRLHHIRHLPQFQSISPNITHVIWIIYLLFIYITYIIHQIYFNHFNLQCSTSTRTIFHKTPQMWFEYEFLHWSCYNELFYRIGYTGVPFQVIHLCVEFLKQIYVSKSSKFCSASLALSIKTWLSAEIVRVARTPTLFARFFAEIARRMHKRVVKCECGLVIGGPEFPSAAGFRTKKLPNVTKKNWCEIVWCKFQMRPVRMKWKSKSTLSCGSQSVSMKCAS